MFFSYSDLKPNFEGLITLSVIILHFLGTVTRQYTASIDLSLEHCDRVFDSHTRQRSTSSCVCMCMCVWVSHLLSDTLSKCV